MAIWHMAYLAKMIKCNLNTSGNMALNTHTLKDKIQRHKTLTINNNNNKRIK